MPSVQTCAQYKVLNSKLTYIEMMGAHYSEDTDIGVAILHCSIQFQHLYVFLAPDSQLTVVHFAPIIFRHACTGGAQPLVAGAHAPAWLCHCLHYLIRHT